MNLPDEKREAVRRVLREHQTIATGLGEWCCSCSRMEWRPIAHRSTHVADALAPLLAGWLAEAWDGALGHVWHLADPAYSVVMTQASKYVVVEADIIQAQLENPYRAALDADAAETTGGGA